MKFLWLLILLLIIASIFLHTGLSDRMKVIAENKIKGVDSIVFKQEQIDTLNNAFVESETEFVYCLKGNIKNNFITVDEITLANYDNSTEHDVIHLNCGDTGIWNLFMQKVLLIPTNNVGVMHNHPNGGCHLSEIDLFTFGKLDLTSLGVICDEDNIHVYLPNNRNTLIRSINIEVK